MSKDYTRQVPPVDYLSFASDVSLGDFQLARLNLAANLRKQVRDLLDDLIDAEAEARLASWVQEHRRALTDPLPRAVQRSLPLEPSCKKPIARVTRKGASNVKSA